MKRDYTGYEKSDHHMMPKGRFPELANEPWNIKTTTIREHRAFNLLFGNDATPHEAMLKILEHWTPQNMRVQVLDWIIARERGRR